MSTPDPDLFRRARARFEELIDGTEAERTQRLAALAREDPGLAAAVRDLLSADLRAEDFLEEPAGRIPAEAWLATAPEEAALGLEVGPYRTLALLGRGGMGEVYLAERADGHFEQRVALKLLRRGMDSDEILRRFLRERQFLARLEHPNIARLLDGGRAADGRPFIVMERVEGEPITQWCAARECSVEERLRLAITCCEAVEAAHHSLIVHRDLKPSNILVSTDGQVKLLDFGIAKLLGEDDEEVTRLTRAGVPILTPAYAAPEQILGGAVTTAIDVYALGVVLYELLTGELPHDRRSTTAAELAVKVTRETVTLPSVVLRRRLAAEGSPPRLARRLEGDLDTILLKALRRNPERRYASAAALAADLRRHLDGEPVAARPDALGYRLAKFVERHRVSVAAAALIVLSLVGGLAAALWQWRRAEEEAARAATQAARAEEAQRFLESVFLSAAPDRAKGAQLTARDLLDNGASQVEEALAHQPELRAEMMTLLGVVYQQLALHGEARSLFEKALAIRQDLDDETHPELAESYRRLGVAIHKSADYAAARPLLERALALHERRGDPLAVAGTLNDLANLARAEGDMEGAQRRLERAVALRVRHGPADSPDLAKNLNNLGLVLQRQEKHAEAARTFERALAIHRKNEGEISSLVAGTEDNLAMVLNQMGQLEAARAHSERALAIVEKLFDRPHPDQARTLNSAGFLAARRGEREAAVRYYERALAIYEATLGMDHPDVAYTMRNIGLERAAGGDPRAALEWYQRALQIREKAHGPEHPNVASSLLDVAAAYRAMGDYAAAEPALRRALAVYQQTVGGDHRRTARALLGLGQILLLRGRPAEAERVLRRCVDISRAQLPAGHEDRVEAESALAEARGG